MAATNKANKVKIDLVVGADNTIPTTNFSRVIGQEAVVRELSFYLKSNKSDIVFPTMLFTGSHGLGKTYVSKILADNLGRKFLEINCGTIPTAKSFIEDILLDRVIGTKPVTILLDEAHSLTNEVSTILLSLLATSPKGINVLSYRGWEIRYDMTKINTILSTTDAFKIFPPLLNRCEPIYFKQYSNADLIKMLIMYLDNITFDPNMPSGIVEEVAYACRGRGRDTYQLAQKIKRYCGLEGIDIFTAPNWEAVRKIFGIYPLGLNERELTLLSIIKESETISCASLAAKMMVGDETISDEIEVRAKELGLIVNSPRGRLLTRLGEEYFEEHGEIIKSISVAQA